MTERRLSLLFISIGVVILTAVIALGIADAVSSAAENLARFHQ
jgi:hypothetical protein